MQQFPNLLSQTCDTNALKPFDCTPDQITETILLYTAAKYKDGTRPFELSITRLPKAMFLKRLFVKPQLQGRGIGLAIVNALKETCKINGIDSFLLHDVLPNAASFWKKHDFHIIGNSGVWWNIKLKQPRS